MDNASIKKEIKRMIEHELKMEFIEGEDLLFGVAGGFDSLSLLGFILDLERKFDVIIPDDDLVPKNFATIDSIADYITTLINCK